MSIELFAGNVAVQALMPFSTIHPTEDPSRE